MMIYFSTAKHQFNIVACMLLVLCSMTLVHHILLLLQSCFCSVSC